MSEICKSINQHEKVVNIVKEGKYDDKNEQDALIQDIQKEITKHKDLKEEF
jgi:hypothetical protein